MSKRIKKRHLERESVLSLALVDQLAAAGQRHAAATEYGIHLTFIAFAEREAVSFRAEDGLTGHMVRAEDLARCDPWLQRYYASRRLLGVPTLGTPVLGELLDVIA